MLARLGSRHKGLVLKDSGFPSQRSWQGKILGTSLQHHHPIIFWPMVHRSLVFDIQNRLFLLGIQFDHHYILQDSEQCKVLHSNHVLEQHRLEELDIRSHLILTLRILFHGVGKEQGSQKLVDNIRR